MAASSRPAHAADEATYLQSLDVDVQNQDDLERELAQKADKLLAERAEENEIKRLEKALTDKDRADAQIRKLEYRLAQPVGSATQQRLQIELDRLKLRRTELNKDVREIQKRIDGQREVQQSASSSHGSGRQVNETRRDYLLRTGQITPFDLINTGGSEGPAAALHDALAGAEDEQRVKEEREQAQHDASHRNLVRPGHDFDDLGESNRTESSSKRQKVEASPSPVDSTFTSTPDARKTPKTRRSLSPSSSASYVASEGPSVKSEDEDYMPDTLPETKLTAKRKRRLEVKDTQDNLEDLSGVDDGDESVYQERLMLWIKTRSEARRREQPGYQDDPNEEEWHKPHPKYHDLELPNGLKVPGDIAHYLFSYQKTGVQWLWELHQQSVGGIVGDEMGLGKTVQAITYVAALHHSKMSSKPAIVVCPATLMVQWVTEFHNWWPALRVSILHSSGSGMLNLKRENNRENALTSEMMGAGGSRPLSSGQKAARKILKRVVEEGHVLVTTYSGLQSYSDDLTDIEWGCAILDEGHKIRNPDAGITFSCKELRTPHRIILSGTPIQNSLIDLWSLFDFVFPMRLGTLVTFKNQFEIPIRQGGYASASNLQVQTAARCAETLKDAITPYLLQRFKTDVASDLPKKSEQVIFCKLTQYQRSMYKRYLASDDMQSICKGKRKSFAGIDILRKICNHPDLADRQYTILDRDYGREDRSGKMQVLKSLLELWRDTGHKTLLFAQTVQMLDILEKFLRSLGGFTFRRMDGGTQIPKRHAIVNEFNLDPELHVFLLTTKVGGIGINLTGADRVIIYDPDWNPSTDMQACERAWRLGQKRDVTIFRLMMKGTIEEKIYHRQIFKQFMTNKITKDPQQREGFQLNDLYDLFSLTEEDDQELETTQLFKNAEITYQEEQKEKSKSKLPSRRRPMVINSMSRVKSPSPAQVKIEEQADDLGRVQGIANVEDFRTAAGIKTETGSEQKVDDQTTDQRGDDKQAEDRLMHSIFSRSGVHAALEHDQIVNGKRVVRPDAKMVEAEARRFANEGAAALRRAEEAARSCPIGVPTWTGQFGLAGRDMGGSSARPGRGGPSSASLLTNLNPGAAANNQRVPARSTPTYMPRGEEFLPLIQNFFRTYRGPITSQVIVSNFNHYCAMEERQQDFYRVLKRVAELGPPHRGRRLWRLKPKNGEGAPSKP
ncbi:DNA repair protein rhp26 [Penicillium verhagenii]|uniref:DNA repair protein rhp26 n=1 Tax=Penicillium verhagenii TaxID=1562060 RepID=UPI002544F78B|nr:DNA repair protein rhp26 [Penicillium verhagenii]KAJ5924153.1 DNA repair protein rhp26 [Penicillium verhagenii]